MSEKASGVSARGRPGPDETSSPPALESSANNLASSVLDRLVGLVVKAPASRAEGPGLESRLRWDFFGVESYQ